MTKLIHEGSEPKELWVTFLGTNGAIRHEHGEKVPNGAIGGALALAGMVQILDHGVAFWGLDRPDSRTVIPFARIIKIEEVF